MSFIPKMKPGTESGCWDLSNLFVFSNMAERVGFEPTLPFRVNTLSKRAPSATRPSLRGSMQYLENVSTNTLRWHRHALNWLPTEHPDEAALKDMVIRMTDKGLKPTGCNAAIRAINCVPASVWVRLQSSATVRTDAAQGQTPQGGLHTEQHPASRTPFQPEPCERPSGREVVLFRSCSGVIFYNGLETRFQ